LSLLREAQSSENHGGGSLNNLQTGDQQLSIAMPELDVVNGGASGLEPKGFAHRERNGFRFGLTNLLGGLETPVAPVQQFMRDLMHQSGKLLGGGQVRKQGNLAAGRDTSGGCDVNGMHDRNGLPCQPRRQALAKTNHVALDLGQMGQVVSGGLADIEYVSGAESQQLAFRRDRFFWERFTLFALAPDHGCQNEDATL